MAVSENYLDPDVAYFLGLIIARGNLQETTGDKKIIIEFPFKNLEAVGIKKHYNQKDHIERSLYQISERIRELVETDLKVETQAHSAAIIIRFLRNSLVWRNINYLLQGKKTYFDFHIPQQILDAPHELQKEFIRGIADVAGFIRSSNSYINGKHRVYLEISNKNWQLPVQLCSLLQVNLGVPVQCIQWGHPNTREPFQPKKGQTWAREHQVKIFTEAFKSIGFYVKYKQEILDEFVKYEAKGAGKIAFSPCNPNPDIRRARKKPRHPEEKNTILHPQVRKHFNCYWEICLALDCKQKRKVEKSQGVIFAEDESELINDEGNQ